MEIAGEERIAEFANGFPSIKSALRRWVNTVAEADWKNPAEMKKTFGSADVVGDQTVFNVGGNKYRIAAFVHYRKQIVYIKRIGPHREYDEWDL